MYTAHNSVRRPQDSDDDATDCRRGSAQPKGETRLHGLLDFFAYRKQRSKQDTTVLDRRIVGVLHLLVSESR